MLGYIRQTLRTLALLTVSIAFVGAGVFIIVAGDSSDAPLALACVALFGACAVVFLIQLLPKQKLVAEPDGAVIVRGSRAQSLVLGLCGVAFAAACPTLGAIAAAEHAWIDAGTIWFGAAFFGWGALYLFWRSLRPPELWRVDTEGVASLAGVKWRVPWTAIQALRRFEVQGQLFIGFELRAEFQSKPTLKTRLARLINAPEFAIGPQGSSAAFEDLAAHVERCWRAAHARS